jgi:hypothetical protein
MIEEELSSHEFPPIDDISHEQVPASLHLIVLG